MSKKLSTQLFIILFIALIVRVITTLISAGIINSDIYSFLTTGNVLLQKTPTYPAFYFPFIFYLGAVSILLGKYIPPLLFLKFIFCLFDVGVTYFVYKLSKNLTSTIIYALNPVMIIIIPIHGQMDSIPLFFLLWSIYAVKQKKEKLSGFLLGVAIATKPWPILFLPYFLKKAQRPAKYISALFVPGLTVIFHSIVTNVPVKEIITPIKNYRGIYGIWGVGSMMYTLFPSWWENNIQFFRRIFLVGFVVWTFFDKKKDFMKEFFLTMLFFFVCTPLFGIQWLSWIVPFLIIQDGKSSLGRIFLMTLSVMFAFIPFDEVVPILMNPVRESLAYAFGLLVWFSLYRRFISYRRLWT